MAIDKDLYRMLKTVNRRVKRLQTSPNLIYEKTSNRMIETLLDKAEKITGKRGKNLVIGDLRPEDRDMYKNILQRFIESPMSTVKGQKAVAVHNKQNFIETYGEYDEQGNLVTTISDDDYLTLTRVLESNTWARFKEKYGTYSGVINEMLQNPAKNYAKAIRMIQGVNRATMKYHHDDGSLNVKAFIDQWRKL